MFSFFGYRGCSPWPRRRRKSQYSEEGEKARLVWMREKRKRNISEPIPIVKSTAAVEQLLRFHGNNNIFILADGTSSVSASPCHRGFNRLFSFETWSTGTEVSTQSESETPTTPRIADIGKTLDLDQMPPVFSETPVAEAFPPKPPRIKERRTFVCQNKDCSKQEIILGKFQVMFRSCNFCFTHYCSAYCQNKSWNDHKKVCYYGKIDSSLKKAHRILQTGNVNFYFSQIAQEGFTSKGKGCLFVVFSSTRCLDNFLEQKLTALRFRPSYSSASDVLKKGVTNDYRHKLVETVQSYDPATEMVINLAVVVGRKIPTNPVPRRREVTVRKIAVVKLHEDLSVNTRQYANFKECLSYDVLVKSNTLRKQREGRRKTL